MILDINELLWCSAGNHWIHSDEISNIWTTRNDIYEYRDCIYHPYCSIVKRKVMD